MRPGTKSLAASALAFAVTIATLACGGNAQLGESCDQSSDCTSGLQCFGNTCTPACETPADCGDGHLCDDGRCDEVISAIGDPCQRELDCGVGQTCLLDEDDLDGDGWLAATCAPQQTGAVVGSSCRDDADCRSSSCNVGHCTEVCAQDSDCQGALTCTEVPRLLPAAAPMFLGCMQEAGALRHTLAVSGALDDVRLPVPGNATSFAITSTVSDPELLTGVYSLIAPNGATLYSDPQTLEEFLANPVRYNVARRESTLLYPNKPGLSLEAGTYRVRFASEFQNGVLAQELPEVTVQYKLDDSAILDLNIHFLDLTDHPCAASIGGPLTAELAPTHDEFLSFLGRLTTIFNQAGIEIGRVSYLNIANRPEYDALNAEDIDELLALAESDVGLNLFIVRSVDPDGIQVLSGGSPAAPRAPSSATNGVALSMDTLCYRDWRDAGRMVAHALGRQMGLFRNREPGSTIEDPIVDSSSDANNLMFFGEFGGIELSPGQVDVLKRYPGLR